MNEQVYRSPNLLLSFQVTIKSGWSPVGTSTARLCRTTTQPHRLPSTIRKSYGDPLNFRRRSRWKSRRLVRRYRCTVVRSEGWVRYCSNFQSSRVIPCCQASSAFSNVATRCARHRRRSRSSCRRPSKCLWMLNESNNLSCAFLTCEMELMR